MEETLKMMNSNPKLNSRDRAVLMNSPFLNGIGSNALVSLFSNMSVVSLPARSTICKTGDQAEAFFCVLSGYVRLYRRSRDGREADIRICAPGDIFGESLLFAGNAYPFHAQTADSCTLARFDLGHVRDLVEKQPDVARSVMVSLSRDLLNTIECLSNDRLFTAPQRVANYLLSRCPVDGGEVSIRLPFQKNLLAGMLGLAPEALSRAFSSLRKAGVTVRGRIVQIGDVEALRNI